MIIQVFSTWLNNRVKPDNRIGGVIVSVFASIAIDRGFEPQSGQTKDYKIGIWCFSAKTGRLGIRIMCPSGVTCRYI